ncbi:MAG TPA: outer membrane beta-barrel protein [Gemmatimonadales bacterium]|jgi:hypothetical protein|nr:outer membrane beta-barrel protein [Gemmatimonadales bacterium]
MIRRHSLLGARIVAVAALLGLPSVGGAQSKFEVVPFLGLYIPTANVVEQVNASCACQVSTRQKTNIDVGARLAMWISDRLSLEGSIGYSPSGVTTTAALYGRADTSARVTTASARVLAALGPRTLNRYVFVSGGIGLVVRGGDAWTGASGRTRFGGTLGVGMRFEVAPPLAVRAELDDWLYSAQFSSASTPQTQSKFQSDLVLSLGLAVPIGGP